MTMTQAEPRTISASGDILNKLQELGEPLLESVKQIKADDRLSPSAKSADIAALVGGHDVMLDNVIEDAQHDAEVALTSAQETLRAARAELNDRIAGVKADDLGIERQTKIAAIEARRTRLATESAQLLQAFGSDDDRVARWSMDTIEQAKDGGKDAKLTLDWLVRVGLRLAKTQSQDGMKYMTTAKLITDAHGEVFDSSKIRAAKSKIKEAEEKLGAIQSAQRNFLPDIRRNRDYRIKEMR